MSFWGCSWGPKSLKKDTCWSVLLGLFVRAKKLRKGHLLKCPFGIVCEGQTAVFVLKSSSSSSWSSSSSLFSSSSWSSSSLSLLSLSLFFLPLSLFLFSLSLSLLSLFLLSFSPLSSFFLLPFFSLSSLFLLTFFFLNLLVKGGLDVWQLW